MGMQGLGGGSNVTYDPTVGETKGAGVTTAEAQLVRQTGSTSTGVGALGSDYGANVWGQNVTQSMGLLSNNGGAMLTLSAPQQDQMRQMAMGINGGAVSSELQSRWSNFVSDMAANGGAIDPNALVQHVLREAYLQNTEDLRFYAEKVKYFNECKKVIREYVSGMRDCQVFLTEELRRRNMPLECPEDNTFTANNEAQEWTHAVQSILSDYAATHPTTQPGRTQSIYSMAAVDSAQEVVTRANDLVNNTFGPPVAPATSMLPPEIEALLTEGAGPPPNEGKLRQAAAEMAMYMTYLGDCGVDNGKFGQVGFDDTGRDVGHTTEHPSYDDFRNKYLSPENAGARSNLNIGDIHNIEEAFGWPPNTMVNALGAKVEDSGNVVISFDAIVAYAQSEAGDAWKNSIVYGTSTTSQQVADMIGAGDANNPAVLELFGTAEAAAEWYAGNVDQMDPTTRQVFLDMGIPGSVPPRNVQSKESLESEIKKWEEKLNSVGDDAQLANVDLQNMLQKQQQTLQMMSNISKMLYDTAMAVVRKIGG